MRVNIPCVARYLPLAFSYLIDFIAFLKVVQYKNEHARFTNRAIFRTYPKYTVCDK